MTATQPDQADSQSPTDELSIALATAGSFQNSIQHADTKAAVLITLVIALAATVLDGPSLGNLIGPQNGDPPTINLIVGALLAILGTGLAGSLWQLGRCIFPRLTGVDPSNRFGFPSHTNVTVNLPSRISTQSQRDEAWRLARLLATIALTKHRAIQASMPWISVATLTALSLLTLTGLLGLAR